MDSARKAKSINDWLPPKLLPLVPPTSSSTSLPALGSNNLAFPGMLILSQSHRNSSPGALVIGLHQTNQSYSAIVLAILPSGGFLFCFYCACDDRDILDSIFSKMGIELNENMVCANLETKCCTLSASIQSTMNALNSIVDKLVVYQKNVTYGRNLM